MSIKALPPDHKCYAILLLYTQADLDAAILAERRRVFWRCVDLITTTEPYDKKHEEIYRDRIMNAPEFRDLISSLQETSIDLAEQRIKEG